MCRVFFLFFRGVCGQPRFLQMRFQKCFARGAVVLAFALPCTTFAGPPSPPAPPEPGATLEQVHALAEQYYDATPRSRPNAYQRARETAPTCSTPRYP